MLCCPAGLLPHAMQACTSTQQHRGAFFLRGRLQTPLQQACPHEPSSQGTGEGAPSAVHARLSACAAAQRAAQQAAPQVALQAAQQAALTALRMPDVLAGQAGMAGRQGTLEMRSCWKSTSRELTRAL